MKFKNQKGQAVLIVLLTLSVVLIVVMFVVSRSITDVSLSVKEENSQRAFSAAEAGIERLLIASTGTIYSDQAIGDAQFTARVDRFAENSNKVTYPISLKSGEIATFWFTRPDEPIHFNGRYIKFCWGDKNTPNNDLETPAIEVTIYYTTTPDDLRTIRVARATFDPSGRTASNRFSGASSGTCTIDEDSFQFYNTSSIDLQSLGIAGWSTERVLQYASVKILYNNTIAHKIGIDVSDSGGPRLPSQGAKIESDGTFNDANRSIEVYQLHPVTPPIFENAIFSSSGITKN